MKNIILLGILFLSLVFARRDCLQHAPIDILGRTMRPEKHTYAISPFTHFYIHYDTTGNAAPDLMDSDGNGVPDYVDEVGIIADSAHHVLVDLMGYEEEPFDGEGGYDIYLTYYSSPYVYGYNYKDPYCTISEITNKNDCIESEGIWVPGASYLKIDNDYTPQSNNSNFGLSSISIMRITVGHEYFHGIQWGYEENLGSNAYFYEMTSMWFEDILIPDGNDYLDGWTGDLLDNPTANFDNTGSGYELALFGHYLSSFLDPKGIDTAKNSTIIREMWERYGSTNSNAFYAVEYVLENNYDISFIEIWTDFMSRNLYNGIYENMDNPFYYYIDQSIVNPIITFTTLLSDSSEFVLELDDESAAIKSFHIGSLESIFTIEHDLNEEEYIGRVAIVSSSEPELNNLFWGSDITVEESFKNAEVHFVYGIDGTPITLPIVITAHTVPLPPSNLMAVVAQDSIILSWNPSPGPGDSLYYVVYRDGDPIGVSIDSDTNYVDLQGVEAKKDYTYKVTCHNDIGESDPSNTIAVTSWPGEENVFISKILSIYPNPIRKSQDITILYALDSDYTNPIIDLINIRGEIVNSYNLSSYNQGWHRENINSILKNNPSTGLYFIRLQPEKGSEKTTKITILN